MKILNIVETIIIAQQPITRPVANSTSEMYNTLVSLNRSDSSASPPDGGDVDRALGGGDVMATRLSFLLILWILTLVTACASPSSEGGDVGSDAATDASGDLVVDVMPVDSAPDRIRPPGDVAPDRVADAAPDTTKDLLPDIPQDGALDTDDDTTTDILPDICLPACDGKECGDDGCGGICGTGCSHLDDPCNTGVCTQGLCQADPAGNGTPCDDGNPGTWGDSCQEGLCLGEECTCSGVWNCCGGCLPINGVPCSDDDACTVGDVCNEGKCTKGTPYPCEVPPGMMSCFCIEVFGFPVCSCI